MYNSGIPPYGGGPTLHFPAPKNRNHYYNLPDQKRDHQGHKFSCDTCNKFFFSKAKFNQHVEEHVDCPFPECKLSAHISVIDKHITNQHMLVNFESLQMDDEAWIAERKKKFPTAERAELRRMEIEERIKSGERIGIEKKKKNKPNTNKPKENTGEKIVKEKQEKKERFNRKHKPKEKNKPRQEEIFHVDLFESDEDNRFGLPAFRGTKKFYEEEGDISYFNNKSTIEESTEKHIEISDEEDWESNNTVVPVEEEKPKNITFGNALGSLIGAYSDSEEEIDQSQVQNKNSDNSSDNKNKFDKIDNKTPDVINPNESNDKNDIKEEMKTRRTRKRKRRGNKHFDKNDEKECMVKSIVKDQIKPKIMHKRRKVTLLQKLLEPDIRHERNIILQCIRYIVQNNFFENSTNISETSNVESEKCTDECENSVIVCDNSPVESKMAGTECEKPHVECEKSAVV